jgi:hypothetical protein
MTSFGFGIQQFTNHNASQSMTVQKGTHPAEIERLWASGARDHYPSFGSGVPGSSSMMGRGFIMGHPQMEYIEHTCSMTPGGFMIVHESTHVSRENNVQMCFHCGQNTLHCRELDGSYKCCVIHKTSSRTSTSFSKKKECPCGNSCVNTEASHMAECSHPRGDWERLHYCHNSRCGCNTIHKFGSGMWKCGNSH